MIGDHKLDTEFFGSHVRHTTFLPDASQGWRRVEVVKTWYRGRELGRGSSATVFLERSEKGEHRAVKVIAKDKSARIDYRRELMAMAMLAKVRGERYGRDSRNRRAANPRRRRTAGLI